ncbi:LacI family DNA-binding transcriptional regulator [Propionibacteriaceae bacterium G1746]|uniref:LacI family DNA-binding transcriptional regulator n=1 Tax=Aestuariimicrobium sp. G57 TaxID=3418485 RepID=UPI003C136F1D
MAATLRDVALLAGVSAKTASNVINDRPHVKPSTREKVEAAIAALAYRPNLTARQLKYGRSGFLTLAIPQIDWPYFAELAARLTEAATEAGYVLLLEVTRADQVAERALMNGVPGKPDGLIFSPLSLSAAEIADRSDATPMVLLGERAVPTMHDHVSVDSVAAGRAITEHLMAIGRTRIAAIGRLSTSGTASVRMAGYHEALDAAGRPRRPEYEQGVGDYLREEGKTAMQRLLALPEPPDAVFAFNDLMAIGALQACREAGVRVPEDVAVAGFDNIAETAYTAPTLTTVEPDLGVLTREVLRLMLGRIEGTRTEAETVHVPWRIVVRQSTGG